MGILGYFQKVGHALMVPIAVLPAAALLMGIGYWIDFSGWGGDSAATAFLFKAGAAIIDNMSVLFAVGVAYGMSKDKDGAAALSGLLGFLLVTTLLAPGAVATIQGIALVDVPFAFKKIDNQFVGILIGMISAELYNKFCNAELPKTLAFFSGRRLVPILVSMVMIILAFILMIAWPLIFSGLQDLGERIAGMGEIGAGLYAFFNRLLIPIGLHHVLNSVFWFDVVGINDIPNFLGGQFSLDAGTAILGKTGMYQAGFFPIMMFGLPGAALAIYNAAKPENKEKTRAIMLTAALASFFTGVTEPLEFLFMFAAPVLYVVHAIFAGLSVYYAASMGWMAGFGFSAGLVDMLLSSQNPLAKQWYMLLVQGAACFVIYYLTFLVLIKGFNLKTPGREDDQVEASASEEADQLANEYINALGGITNLEEVDACITRLRLTLKNRDLINVDVLEALGAMGVIKLGENDLQVILGPQAENIAKRIKALK